MKPEKLDGSWKRGSAWNFGVIRKDDSGAGVDISGMAARMQFRVGSETGAVLVTLTTAADVDESGLRASETVVGQMDVLLMPAETVLFPVSEKVYFDLRLVPDNGHVLQSRTYYMMAEQEVTLPEVTPP